MRSVSRDTIFVGGHYYAGSGVTRRGGVAIRDGRIIVVGSEEQVRDAAGSNAEVVDLAGGLVSPSFGDAHLHPVNAGVELGQCDLHGAGSAGDTLERVAAYAASHPGEDWILGAGWAVEHFPQGIPTRHDLDRIVSDRPVLLHNNDHHAAWLNSRALEAAGISQATPDPPDGRIERDAAGHPIGTLQEGAVRLATAVAPEPTRRTLLDGLLLAQERCFQRGITHWQDALLRLRSSGRDGLAPYLDALVAGSLLAKVNGAIWWDRNHGLDQVDEILAATRRAHGRFRVESVKIMVDGVVENFTASLSSPYIDAHGHATDNTGISFLEREQLVEVVEVLDQLGLQVHFHTLGDRAVADALDAIANARRRNPSGTARHHLAHLQIVRAADVPRFRALDAIANIQPLWAFADEQFDAMTVPFIDPALIPRHYPFAELEGAGTRLAAGSDWPVSSLDPLEGMHVAVSRTPLDGTAPPFLPEQSLSLGTIWDAYTSGVAYVNGREREFGRLLPGMSADLVVLDRDPFDRAGEGVRGTRVMGTWVDGQRVFGSEDLCSAGVPV